VGFVRCGVLYFWTASLLEWLNFGSLEGGDANLILYSTSNFLASGIVPFSG